MPFRRCALLFGEKAQKFLFFPSGLMCHLSLSQKTTPKMKKILLLVVCLLALGALFPRANGQSKSTSFNLPFLAGSFDPSLIEVEVRLEIHRDFFAIFFLSRGD